MTQTKRQLAFDASMKILLAVLSAASIFAFAFFWSAAYGGTEYIKEAEAGFNLSALKLVGGATLLFILIAAIAGFTSKDHDGRTKHRAALLVIEYVDDVGGVLGSAGGVALFLGWNGKGATFGWWGLALLAGAFAIKFLCALGAQRLAPPSNSSTVS